MKIFSWSVELIIITIKDYFMRALNAFSDDKFMRTLNALNVNKAPGIDKIPGIALNLLLTN